MKTNQTISKNALSDAFYHITDKKRLTDEIILVVKNTSLLYGKLLNDCRSKIHSIAFYALFEIVKNSRSLPVGYYVSNPQMKKFLLENYGSDYQDLLIDACKELEKIRNEHLEG